MPTEDEKLEYWIELQQEFNPDAKKLFLSELSKTKNLLLREMLKYAIRKTKHE